ncbi:hypothetical protein VMCG_08866 [Cytospora schulzeri]|uniref:Protein kinase domain-containing protein n=1 Tax=Cytospora schulzeri TaxID=448051 RepID=A0A423VUQ8_9PEZI|nr:hypothetical protein VMCG_08866 [Valsa malicola]
MALDHTATVAWFPDATAETLPPMMLETDPRLSCQHLEDHLQSIIGNSSQCPIYRYSNTLAYKPICRKRETKLMVIADNLTLPVVSKVGIVDDVSSQWYQKGALMELGDPLDVTKILPAERVSIARHMVVLVTGLHGKGIIHGDIKPENFVKKPGEDTLKIADFSSARMIDDSDLSTWPSEIASVEYTSPNRDQDGGPSTFFDDYFALAVSIWAVFAGQRPLNGLFNSNEGHTPDLSKITENELFCSVVDVLKEGGLELDVTNTLIRRESFNADGLDRTISFPLSLFGADPDDLDEPKGVKVKPQFCPHCFELAMLGADNIRDSGPQHPVEYPELCHLRNSGANVDSVSDYALQWLDGQETASEGGAAGSSMLQANSGNDRSRSRSPANRPSLRVDTNSSLEVEKPQWSGVSSVTITAGDQTHTRDRSDTVRGPLPAAPSESDEGYESMGRRTSRATNELGVKTRPRGSSFQRTMSTWSESSAGSNTDYDNDDVEAEGSILHCSSPPRTPYPLNISRLQVTSSFESVSLSDAGDGGGSGTWDAIGTDGRA